MTNALMVGQEESESHINYIIRRFNMTDSLLQQAEIAGQEITVEQEESKSYGNMFIIGVLIIGAAIMGWQIYEFLTPDPWYIRMNPF